MKLADLLLGGPGHDGYAYNADTYCIDCGQEIIGALYANGAYFGAVPLDDSERFPQPIFFGESDTAQCCADCGEHLYGPESDDCDSESSEPEEDDYTTEDHIHFYQSGKLAFTVPGGADGDHVAALRAHMEQEQFWPNVWFVSDHGNAHLIDLD